MFNYFLTQLTRSIVVFGRTIRAFVIRRCSALISLFRRVTNVARGSVKVANSAMQSVMAVSQNPSRPEDYVETRRLLISKAFILRTILALAALGLFIYFVGWPFVLSRFLTARFYTGDKRVEDWSGKVIVYADKKKTVPMYAGRLEDGVLQGSGKKYDENGVLCYEGQFQDGLYSGTGTEYLDGTVIYTGQFSLGVREGSGTEYRDGMIVYEGQFQGGVYEGRGKRFEDGVLRYEGSFQDGAASGTGVAYYPDGKTAYSGQFSQDLYEGDGTAYDPSGAVLYRGGFSAGVYSGDGVLTVAPGQKLEASFAGGEPDGTVRWSKDGKLYYQGEWAKAAPEGYGTLYNKSGATLYQGQFSCGTPDGTWLLTLSAKELREVLGTYEESSAQNGGFLISSPALGLTALCSFQTEDAEAAVYSVSLYPPKGDASWVQVMPGADSTAAENWPEDAAISGGEMEFAGREGVPVPSGAYLSETVKMAESRYTVLYGEDGEAVLAVWSLLDAPPEGLESAGGDELPMDIDGILAWLGQTDGTEGSLPGESSGEKKWNVQALLAACVSADEAKTLADTLLDWWELDVRLSAETGDRARLQTVLDEARASLAAGTGDQASVTALEHSIAQADWQIEQDQLEKGKLEIMLGRTDPSRYDISKLTVSFDPTGTDAAELTLLAAAYAQAIGNDIDPEKLETDVKQSLVEMDQAYLRIQNALEVYQWSAQAVKDAAGAYAMGGGSKADWYQAISARESARADLCAALAEFTRLSNALNHITGGWVSRSFSWYPDVLVPLYEAEIQPAASDPPTVEPQENEAPGAAPDQDGQAAEDGSQSNDQGG